jgi:hypothetical protein
LEHTLCGSAELLGIVIAPYQHLVAAKRTNNRRPLAFLCPDEIAKNVCVVTSFYQSLQAMSSFMRFSICATYCTLSLHSSLPPLYPQMLIMANVQMKIFRKANTAAY